MKIQIIFFQKYLLRIIYLFITTGSVLFFSIPLNSAETLGYSGRLVNDNGSPVAGPVTLRVDLVYSGDPTTVLCTDDIANVPLTKGVFHIKMDLACSGSTPLTQVLSDVPTGQSVAIRVTDVTNTKVYSFQNLNSIPFANLAETARQLVQMGAVNGQILKWNNSTKKWEPGTAGGTGTVTTVSGTNPLSVATGTTTPVISMTQANGSTNGYLSSADWTTFNNKEVGITAGTTAQYYRGDKSFQTLDTAAVPEAGAVNLYFSNARALGVPLTGFAANSSAIAATDTMLGAFGKAQGQINTINTAAGNFLVKNNNTTGDAVTGIVNVNTTGLLQLGYVPIGLNDASNKSYVDTKLDKAAGGTVAGVVTFDNNIKIKNAGAATYVTISGGAGTADYTLNLPANQGSNGQVLTMTSTPGVMTWATPSAPGTGTVTNVTGTAPIVVATGTSIPAISITNAASGVTGALSGVDWDTFNNKIGPTLASGNILVGSGSNVATAVAMSGDVTITNTGVTAIGSDKVTNANIASDSISPTKLSGVRSGSRYLRGDNTWATFADDVGNSSITTVAATTGLPRTAIVSADTVNTAINKTQGQLNYIAANTVTKDGVSFLTGVAAAVQAITTRVTVPTPLTTDTTDVANVNYVNTAVAGSQPWTVATGNVYRATGNVGIGTTTPRETLEVTGSAFFTNFSGNPASGKGIDIYYDNTNDLGSVRSRDHAAGTMKDMVLQANNLRIETSGAERLRINSFGNVGIGTNTPLAKLQIDGATQLTANLTDAGSRDNVLSINGNSTSSGAGGALSFGNVQSVAANSVGFAAIKGLLMDGSNNTSGHFAISTRNSSLDTALTERLRILNNGNVGIGTTSPSSKLQVIGSASTVSDNGVVSIEDTLRRGLSFGYDTVNDWGWIYSRYVGTSAKPLAFFSNNAVTSSPQMLINVAGNIGIGTTAPTALLHLKAGSASANTAPLKFTSGTNLATPEPGAIEYDGTNLYFTDSTSTRSILAGAGLGSTVSSVNGNTGAVTLTTTNVAEGTNLYYTNTRTIAAPLTGLSAGANSALAATDTILGAFGKVQGQINAREAAITAGTTAQYIRGDKTLGTFASDVLATPLTGLSTATNSAAAATDTVLVGVGKLQAQVAGRAFTTNVAQIITAAGVTGLTAPIAGSDAANKTYVDDSLSATGVWSKSGSDVYRASGNVGIGITSPGALLHVLGATAAGSYLQALNLHNTTYNNGGPGGVDLNFINDIAGSNNIGAKLRMIRVGSFNQADLAIFTNNLGSVGDVSTEKMRVTSAGNVGIGTTAPGRPLTVINTGSNPQLRLGYDQTNAYWDLGRENASTGRFQIINGAAGELFSILNNGNVGIGSTSPNNLLTVANNSIVGNSVTQAQVYIKNSLATGSGHAAIALDKGATSAVAGFGFLSAGATQWDAGLIGDNNFAIRDTVNVRKIFNIEQGAPANSFYVNSSGNVGIGTATPGQKLEVTGAILLRANGSSAANAMQFSDSQVGGNIWQILNGFDGVGKFSFYESGVGTRMMIQSSTGYVGIGTTSPSEKLHIHAPAGVLSAGQRSSWTDTTSYGEWNAYEGSTFVGALSAFGSNYTTAAWQNALMLTAAVNNSGSIQFRTRNSGSYIIPMIISNAGNVGIGLTSPTSTLHLKAGTAAASTAPLKLTAGVNLTTPEPGAIEFDGTNLYYTDSTSARKTLGVSGSGVTSVNTFTGAVTLTTANISENTNLYFTNARAIASTITGYAVGSNAVLAATDTILGAFGKIQAQISAKESAITAGTTTQYLRGDKSLSTFGTDVLGTVLSGFSTATNSAASAADTLLVGVGKLQAQVSGRAFTTNVAQIITAASVTGLTAPLAGSDAANKTYVDDSLSATGVWTKSGSDVYRASGNVGIGTTTPGFAAAAGRNYLTISGSTGAGVTEYLTNQADADVNGIGVIQFTDKNSIATTEKRVSAIVGALDGSTANNRGGALKFFTRPNNTDVALAERVRIDNVGNVGIGTTTPSTNLHVATGSSGRIQLGAAATTGYYSQIDQNNIVLNTLVINSNGDTDYRQNLATNNGSGNIAFYTGLGTAIGGSGTSTEKMRITSAGNVGIGTTIPTTRLSVYNTDPSVVIAARTDYVPNLTANSGSNFHGAWSSVGPASSYNFTGALYAAVNRVQSAAGQSGSIGTSVGSQNDVVHYGTGAITEAIGASIGVANYSTGSITSAHGGKFYIIKPGGGAITNGYGVRIDNIEATNKWSIYASDATAPTYIAGNVGIGTTTPATMLSFGGSVSASRTGYYATGAVGSTPRNDVVSVWESGENRYGLGMHSGAMEIFAPVNNTIQFGNRSNDGFGTFTPTVTVLNGNVGIGTSSPTSTLDIVNTGGVIANFASTMAGSVALRASAPGSIFYDLYNSAAATGAKFIRIGHEGNGFSFQSVNDSYTSATALMVIGVNGKVGIGTNTPAYQLDVVGDIRISGTPYRASGDIAWTVPSDERLKDITRRYDKGLKEIVNLETIKYRYKKDNEKGLDSNKEYTGVIAQKVSLQIPEAITKDREGYLALNTTPIFWAMVNSIKELFYDSKAQSHEIAIIKKEAGLKISQLEKSNQELILENSEIKARLEKIEKMVLKKL